MTRIGKGGAAGFQILSSDAVCNAQPGGSNTCDEGDSAATAQENLYFFYNWDDEIRLFRVENR